MEHLETQDFKILVTAQVLGFGIWIGLWPRACQKPLKTKQVGQLKNKPEP